MIDGTMTAHAHASGTTLLIVLQGHLRCRGTNLVETRLRQFDAVHLTDGCEPVDVVGTGVVVRIDVIVS